MGVIASKKETEEIKNKIQEFLKNNLLLKLNSEKTKIIHNSNLVRFLGYDVSVMRCDTRTSVNGKIGLWLPYDIMKNFIIDNRYGEFVRDPDTGKPKLKGIHKPEMAYLDEFEILAQYNYKIRGFYNYYRLALNVSKMGNYNYIWKTSFFRTLAGKYKTKCGKLYRNKNYFQNKMMGITYNNKFYALWNGPFTTADEISSGRNVDMVENINRYFNSTSYIKRLEAKVCDHCGDTDGPFEIHHVNKLKHVKKKKTLSNWEKAMISRQMKVVTLCVKCHDKLHAGKLN